jgi:beta-lactam-binding protein with PASTA domain
MFLIRRWLPKPTTRGQALVEFALVLPLLALLLVVAVDFSRVFFGWVSLTNAARVGANYAGYTPNLMSDTDDRTEYGTLIHDAVTGCDLTPTNMADPSYDPVFTDVDGDGKNNGWGDHVTVTISCQLHLITPLAGAIVGQNVPMRAQAVFPIRQGEIGGPGGGGTPPNPPCTQSRIPDLINRTVADARLKWTQEGFLAANFSPPPGANETYLVSSQTFTPSANVQDCVDPAIQHVTITSVPPPPCPSGQAQVPDLVGMLVSQAKTAWTAAGFTGAFKPNNAVDTKTVLSQATNPSAPINTCLAKTAEVTITWGDPPPPPCNVPNMIGLNWAQAQSAWTTQGFTKALKKQGNSNSPNTVKEQTPNHPGVVACDVDGTVKF